MTCIVLLPSNQCTMYSVFLVWCPEERAYFDTYISEFLEYFIGYEAQIILNRRRTRRKKQSYVHSGEMLCWLHRSFLFLTHRDFPTNVRIYWIVVVVMCCWFFQCALPTNVSASIQVDYLVWQLPMERWRAWKLANGLFIINGVHRQDGRNQLTNQLES